MGTSSQPPHSGGGGALRGGGGGGALRGGCGALRGGCGSLRRLDARPLAGLFRIALVPALRVLCPDVSLFHAQASTRGLSGSLVIRSLLALRLRSEAVRDPCPSRLPRSPEVLAVALSVATPCLSHDDRRQQPQPMTQAAPPGPAHSLSAMPA